MPQNSLSHSNSTIFCLEIYENEGNDFDHTIISMQKEIYVENDMIVKFCQTCTSIPRFD